METPLYRFMELPEPPPLKHKLDTIGPDDPTNDIYGRVCFERDNIRIRASAAPDPLWAVFAGPVLIRTTYDVMEIARYVG